MRLFWFGHSCFLFEGEIDNITVLIDPFSGIGLPAPEGIKPDIGLTTHSHFDHNAFGRIRCRKIYHEAKGRLDTAIPITGFELSHDEMDGKKRGKITAYSIVIDGIRIIHLGDLGTTLGSEDIERLQNPDVLLVPVGGIFTLNGKTAVEVIKQLKPRIAIPMHYKVKGLLMDIDTVDMFLSEMEKSGLNTVIEKMNKNYIFLSLADMDTNTIKIMVLGEEFQPYKPIDSSILRPETLAEPHPSETVNER
ncbi:MAG: MBL fold metallo-hydrolase, partial [Thermoplasmata archaeon]